MREIRMLRLTRRGLETWPWWNCEPTEQSKEFGWKPSTYSERASPRPYLRAGGGSNPASLTRRMDFKLDCQRSEVSPAHETHLRCTHIAPEATRDGVG